MSDILDAMTTAAVVLSVVVVVLGALIGWVVFSIHKMQESIDGYGSKVDSTIGVISACPGCRKTVEETAKAGALATSLKGQKT